jgi:hypothetical protein
MTRHRPLQKLWAYLLAKPYYAALLLFPLILNLYFDIRPLERFPGWDLFWSDAIVSGKLSLLRMGLSQGEIPAISPYHGLGHNTAGDGPALTPFISPFSALLPFAGNQAIIQFRFVCYVYLGLAGVYLLLRRMGTGGSLATISALLYVAIPVQFSNQQYYFTIGFYALPALVYGIYCYAESKSPWDLFVISLVAFLTYSATDIFFLIITPVVAFSVAAFAMSSIAIWKDRLAYLTKVCGVVVLSGCFYILPLYHNLHESTAAAVVLKSLGLTSPAPITSVSGFWGFFQYFGMPTFYMPQPSSAMSFYVPSFFCFYIVLYCVLGAPEQITSSHRRVGFALITAACGMFALSFAYYALPEKMIESGKGILRYHLNLWPFFIILAACLFIASPLRRSTQLRIIFCATLLSVILDFFLFCIKYPAPGADSPAGDWFLARHEARFATGLTTPNLFSVRFLRDMWLALPILNILVPALLAGILATQPMVKRWKGGLLTLLVIGVLSWCVLYIGIHNELRATQESGWQQIGRSSYHLDTFRLRKASLEALLPTEMRRNYRLLPASADVFQIQRGRNWKFCADTEMLAESGFKMLFTYREMEHPFTGLLYSKFYTSFSSSNFFPPLSERIPATLDVARLLGVRYIVSADMEIKSPDLTLLQRIDVPSPPFHETVAGGPVYVYELAGATGIASFADRAIVLSQREAIKRIADWNGQQSLGELSLEQVAALPPASQSAQIAPATVNIASATLNSVTVEAKTPTDGFVNLAYLYRPFWSATVNGVKVPVQRANGFMMSVPVPAGAAQVKFHYTPWDVYAGYGITLATLLGLLVLALRSHRRAAVVHAPA